MEKTYYTTKLSTMAQCFHVDSVHEFVGKNLFHVSETHLDGFERGFNIGEFLLLGLLLLQKNFYLRFLQVLHTLVYNLLPDPDKDTTVGFINSFTAAIVLATSVKFFPVI